jgi:hypothetical protein
MLTEALQKYAFSYYNKCLLIDELLKGKHVKILSVGGINHFL